MLSVEEGLRVDAEPSLNSCTFVPPTYACLGGTASPPPSLLFKSKGNSVLFLSKTGRDQHIVGGVEKRRFSLMRNWEQIWFPNLNFLLHRNNICI